jgi:hypothetical protein
VLPPEPLALRRALAAVLVPVRVRQRGALALLAVLQKQRVTFSRLPSLPLPPSSLPFSLGFFTLKRCCA